MLLSTVFIWFLIVTATAVAIPSLWLVAEAVDPVRSRQRCDAAASGLVSSFLIGLVPAVIAFAVAAGLLRGVRGPAGVLVVAGVGVVLMWSLVGAGGIAAVVGGRLWPAGDASVGWLRTARGGMLLVGMCLLPVFGWFGLLPVLTITGLGIQLRSRFRRRPMNTVQPAATAAGSATDPDHPAEHSLP